MMPFRVKLRLFLVALLFTALALFNANQAQAQSGNRYGLALASAARTAAQVNSPDITNSAYTGVHVLVNISAYTSGNYTPKIQGKDPTSGTYYDILVGPALSATGITVLKVYPGIAPLANGSAADFIPYTWRVQLNGLSTPSMTFSVSYFSEQ